MTKKIAVINDLSGFGKCSLTAAIPVISVMGVQPCPLPTAVLSAQTGYPSYYLDDYTEKMEYIRQEWERMEICFDGIYTGFVGNEAQIRQVRRFLETFQREGTFLLVDPIMGDEGRRFDFCTEEMLREMKELVTHAEVVTPNLMELCLLTGVDYEDVMQACRGAEKEIIAQLAGLLLTGRTGTVIVTGIRLQENGPGIQEGMRIGNLTVTREGAELSTHPYIGGSFSGTGDLFASVVAGGIARGEDVFETVRLAGAFIEAAMRDAVEEQVPRNEGANFERHLGMLIRNCSEGESYE